jgi:predicted MFS family arabinose efflux permease
VNRSLAPFRHRMFAILWTGAFVSNVGTWMESVAVGILVTHATGEAIWTGLVAAAGFVPVAVLAPVGGALADRVPRRHLLIVTSSIQTVLASVLTLLAATGRPGPGIVTLIVFAAGCVQAIGFPAYQAVLPDLVPHDEIVSAVALSSAQWNLGRIVGPALAGLVIELGGYEWAFAFNTLSFLAVIFAVVQLHLPPPAGATRYSIFASVRQGFDYARRDPGMRVVIAYMAVNSLFAAPFIGLVAYMGEKVFDGGTAILVTAQGIGAVAMALSLSALAHRFGNARVLAGVLWGLPPALVVYAVMPTIALSAIAIFVVGFLYLGALSSFTSIAQLRAPAEVRGRVMGLLMVLLGSFYPVGTIIQGALADAIGLRATTAGAAIIMLAILVVAKVARPRFASAVEEPVAPFEGFASGAVEAP